MASASPVRCSFYWRISIRMRLYYSRHLREVQDLLATDPELCEEENINLQHYLEIFFEDQKSRLNL